MSKAVVTAESNIGKTKQTRTPKDYTAIEKGALALELKDRVKLRDNLTRSIDEEINKMEENLKAAKELVK
ncbi:MAG: hypothetical protein Q8941_24555 [Bacteroidota bacterium]|nr:hypothetical protein [Bacteroidota bacterium]